MEPREFLEKYVALCRESGFCLTSDDSYEPIILSRLDSNSFNYDEVLDDDWVDITLDGFSSL